MANKVKYRLNRNFAFGYHIISVSANNGFTFTDPEIVLDISTLRSVYNKHVDFIKSLHLRIYGTSN